MLWNVPNTLTWIRIAAIPLIVLLFFMPYPWADPAAGLLFAAAGITDSLDGYLARKMGQTSRLGAFLDPVADKLIVAVALVLLVSKEMPLVIVPGLEHLDGQHATLRPESVRAIPRNEPMPPTIVAARLISITWLPTAGFIPSVMAVRMAPGTTMAEPIANAYCATRPGSRPNTRIRSGFSDSARMAMPVCVRER